jgi:long-chain acyl-CoA synthetase
MNVADNLDRAARAFPDKPAIYFEDRAVTFAELQSAVDRTAHELVGLGVAPGDRIGLFLPNTPAFSVAYYATLKTGAIAVSISAALTRGEVEHIVADSGANVVFTAEPQLENVDGLAEHVLVPDEMPPGGNETFRPLKRERDDPAAILYTSGTTGKQKGATLSHGNVISNAWAGAHHMGVTPDDRLLLFLPLFHCFGQNAIMNSAFTRGASIVMHRRFVPDEVVPRLARDGATMFFAVPAVYIGLLNASVSKEALASVRYFFSAAATMPVEIADRWRETYGLSIFEGYGLTETSPFASYNHDWHYRPGSVGTPIENCELRVVDEDDNVLGPGEWGEICMRGPNVMLGYWNRPEESAQALRGGWFHSGDIGYVDEDGYYFLVDRVKDMINAAGFKIWPREVEEVLYTHPAITECAVVGVAHDVKGEVAKAVVVLGASHEVSEDELRAFCREHLAAYKVPEQYEFVDELPKNPTGKILKRVLRERAAAPTS